MLNAEEVRWIKATANELNNLIQVIADSNQLLGEHCSKTPESERYLSFVTDGVKRAAKVIQAMAQRVDRYEDDPQIESGPPAKINCSGSQENVLIRNINGPRELILIVDDEEFVTLLVEHILTEQGYRVITTAEGFSAIEVYRKLQSQIALIILDFNMPGLDGADVFDELLAINPNVAVVLSSGFTEHARLSGMLSKGLRGFIPKPYTHDKLLTQVRTVLDTIKAEQLKTGNVIPMRKNS